MDFKNQDPELFEALTNFNKSPVALIEYFKTASILLGLLVDTSKRQLVLSKTSDFKALACFSTEQKLNEFSMNARPSISSGKAVAEFALKSESRLLHIDPPLGKVISGSILKSIVSEQKWSDLTQNQFLKSTLSEQLARYRGVNYTLHPGEWADLKIVLGGDFDSCTKAASDLGRFLAKDQKVIELLPSGADIVYSS